MANAGETIKVQLKRGNGVDDHYAEYEVPALESQTVLDVVTWIQRNRQPEGFSLLQ